MTPRYQLCVSTREGDDFAGRVDELTAEQAEAVQRQIAVVLKRSRKEMGPYPLHTDTGVFLIRLDRVDSIELRGPIDE